MINTTTTPQTPTYCDHNLHCAGIGILSFILTVLYVVAVSSFGIKTDLPLWIILPLVLVPFIVLVLAMILFT